MPPSLPSLGSTAATNTQRRPPVIGLTGAVASGKSAAAEVLSDAGCDVIDVDALGHEALLDNAVIAAVTQDFGVGVRGADGTLDRAALAAIAFREPESLQRLERIVHPWVRTAIAARLSAATPATSPAVVVSAIVINCALLFESGLETLCEATWCISAPADERRARAQRSRGWDADEVSRREARQLSAEEKSHRATREIPNDGDLAQLDAAVRAALTELTAARTGTAGAP